MNTGLGKILVNKPCMITESHVKMSRYFQESKKTRSERFMMRVFIVEVTSLPLRTGWTVLVLFFLTASLYLVGQSYHSVAEYPFSEEHTPAGKSVFDFQYPTITICTKQVG